MKNAIRLIFLFNLLITNNLSSQIEATALDIVPTNEKTRPLSIDGKCQMSNAKFLMPDALSPTQNSKLETQNLMPDALSPTQNSKLETQNSKLKSQNFKLIDFFQGSDTFDRKRFWGFIGASATAYTGAVLLLDKVWYAQYEREAFHLFDDKGEWLDMDKGGHVLTAYTETKWIYGAMKWTGLSNRKAAWTGMATGTVLQATLEVLDGYSTEWGFSWADMAANTAGCALFGVQQAAWNEQRIVLKVSNTPRNYSNTPIRSTDGSKTSSIKQRTDELYGTNYAQTFFKDYNALTWWLSINPKSFYKDARFPAWLNIAVGYGGDNMFGGYNNVWPTKKPEFVLSTADFPRYRQYYLSLDIDLSKIKTKSKFLNTLAKTFNFIKIPAPTLEFNSLGKVKFHPLFF
jgi:uncharacterized protein YfiM (DUF2279 family)